MQNYKFDPKLISKAPVPYNKTDCLITAKLLEPQDTDNSLKNLYNKFIRNSEVDCYDIDIHKYIDGDTGADWRGDIE